MFGLSLPYQLLQGSAQRTWKCVTYIANYVWYKFSNRQQIMPRSRRRHHSRSRSRSHSHDRDRDAKRRKVESYESPHHRRSVSSGSEETEDAIHGEECQEVSSVAVSPKLCDDIKETDDVNDVTPKKTKNCNDEDNNSSETNITPKTIDNNEKGCDIDIEKHKVPEKDAESDMSTNCVTLKEVDQSSSQSATLSLNNTPSGKGLNRSLQVTPIKTLSPKQLQRKTLSEQKRLQKEKEREEREKQKQEEKLRIKEEKLKLKQQKEEQKKKEKEDKEEQKKKEREEKEEQKRKEREQKEELKRREREEKEQKRREKEERDEQKRKEKELEKQKKQQEIDEKNREKQKLEEQKQKAAAAFASFFRPLKPETCNDDEIISATNFKPFKIKSDMKLAPTVRRTISDTMKEHVVDCLLNQNSNEKYLTFIKSKQHVRTCGKTWPIDESDIDVVLVEESDVGEVISEEQPKARRCRAKLLQFHDNRRPAYYGTWSKCSKVILPRRPFGKEKELFDYDYDSDDDWEEEEQGESIAGSDEDEKDRESEDDYEVDNQFFVPHGHLSDDEVDDEKDQRLSPESHKAKLKLLKNEFDEEMKSKTQKIKPRVIGCHWHKKNDNFDEVIDRYLQPLAMLHNGPIAVTKRSKLQISSQKKLPKLDPKMLRDFLIFVHGNKKTKRVMVDEFIARARSVNSEINISRVALMSRVKKCAHWDRVTEENASAEDFCWQVNEEIKKKYDI